MEKAAIFDMDGVLVDNHNYHLRAWNQFCDSNSIPFLEDEFREKYFGKNNFDILSGLLNRIVSAQEAYELGEAKEAVYRDVYRNHIKPVMGLLEFIQNLKIKGYKLAVATSAYKPNLDFVLNLLRLTKSFDALVDASMVRRSKPDPEIFLKASELLGVNPCNCIVFEDSVSGINAANAAGMDVIALLTTHVRKELPQANLYINDFRDKTLFDFLQAY